MCVGSRAIATELVCRVWQLVQVPIVPSAFGLPTAWHCSQPLVIADAAFERARTDAAAAALRRADTSRRNLPARESVPFRHRRPPTKLRRGGCAELLVDSFVAAAAVARRQMPAETTKP